MTTVTFVNKNAIVVTVKVDEDLEAEILMDLLSKVPSSEFIQYPVIKSS